MDTKLTAAQAKAIVLIKEQYGDSKEFNAPHDYSASRSVSRVTMMGLVAKGIIRVVGTESLRVSAYGQRSEFSDTGRRTSITTYAWA